MKHAVDFPRKAGEDEDAGTAPLRLAMLGMIPGNGHPYSWSAIINGYDRSEMARCPYPAIPEYLGKHALEHMGISDAVVTHIWTDDPEDARNVARAAKISHVVSDAMEVIGKVDAVIIATDDGTDHVRRARPFVEAGLPVFVDKPLATTREELRQFVAWERDGARILSSSGMRYAPELDGLKGEDWLWISSTTCKTLERYGIHALEPVFVLLGPGFETVQCSSTRDSHLVQLTHESGRQATLAILEEGFGSFGNFHAYGAQGHRTVQARDTFSAFRNQLCAAIAWFRTGLAPFPFAHTKEMMAVIIAALESRAQGGARITVRTVLDGVDCPASQPAYA